MEKWPRPASVFSQTSVESLMPNPAWRSCRRKTSASVWFRRRSRSGARFTESSWTLGVWPPDSGPTASSRRSCELAKKRSGATRSTSSRTPGSGTYLPLWINRNDRNDRNNPGRALPALFRTFHLFRLLKKCSEHHRSPTRTGVSWTGRPHRETRRSPFLSLHSVALVERDSCGRVRLRGRGRAAAESAGSCKALPLAAGLGSMREQSPGVSGDSVINAEEIQLLNNRRSNVTCAMTPGCSGRMRRVPQPVWQPSSSPKRGRVA